MATIENVADMLFSGLTSVAMGSYARTPPQAERTQSHRPQRGELLAEPALNVAGSISFRFHVVCVSYNTHALQGFSSRTVSLSPHTKRQATSTQRQQKTGGGQADVTYILFGAPNALFCVSVWTWRGSPASGRRRRWSSRPGA